MEFVNKFARGLSNEMLDKMIRKILTARGWLADIRRKLQKEKLRRLR